MLEIIRYSTILHVLLLVTLPDATPEAKDKTVDFVDRLQVAGLRAPILDRQQYRVNDLHM